MKTLAGGKSKATAGGRFKEPLGSKPNPPGSGSRFITGPNIKGPNPLQDLQPSVMRFVKR